MAPLAASHNHGALCQALAGYRGFHGDRLCPAASYHPHRACASAGAAGERSRPHFARPPAIVRDGDAGALREPTGRPRAIAFRTTDSRLSELSSLDHAGRIRATFWSQPAGCKSSGDVAPGAGLTIAAVARGRNWIAVSGAAAQIESAFQTELHQYPGQWRNSLCQCDGTFGAGGAGRNREDHSRVA